MACWKIPYAWRFQARKITDMVHFPVSHVWWHRRLSHWFSHEVPLKSSLLNNIIIGNYPVYHNYAFYHISSVTATSTSMDSPAMQVDAEAFQPYRPRDLALVRTPLARYCLVRFNMARNDGKISETHGTIMKHHYYWWSITKEGNILESMSINNSVDP